MLVLPATRQGTRLRASRAGAWLPAPLAPWLLTKVLASLDALRRRCSGAVASLYGYKGARIAPDAGLDTILAGAARGRADCRTAQLPLVTGDSPIGEP